MTIKYKQFNRDFIENTHGKLYFYRDLYEGNHGQIFHRAKRLIEKGELLDNILRTSRESPTVQTPYIIANVTKLIVDVPAILVSRSIGKIDTSLTADESQIAASNQETFEAVEGPTNAENRGTVNGEIINLQQELIKTIVQNSNLKTEHWSNIVQFQLDGGLVGVPWDGDRGLRIEFKGRDVYFPHEDGLGADLTYDREIDEINYLHVYRERLMRQGDSAEAHMSGEEEPEDYTAPADGLRCTHKLYKLGTGGILAGGEIPTDEAADLLNLDPDEMKRFYPGRQRLFIRYMANEKTFMNPLGVSAIRNQEGKQDEINWTLTRTAGIFERNGKPRLAINKELAAALQKEMVRLYGEAGRGKFDTAKLEVISMNEKGQSMEIIQIDVSKIGDVQWVKDLLKMMLMETKTSEKAIDFYMSNDGGSAQSGIAKFYDLFISLMKAEMIQTEYVDFLKGLIEDALWLANFDDASVIIEQPEIKLVGMLPIERKELIDTNMAMYAGANGKTAQSLETTVRNNNPDASEEWIQEELARIEAEKQSDDSTSLASGRQTLETFLDNPNTRPPASAEDEE